MRAVGLFSGIGGFELGLQRAGIATDLLCEWWDPAASVLRRRFDADVLGDIRELSSLPATDVVTAGFPCTDLSQVGRTAGIEGNASGLVREVFRLVESSPPRWVVLENVPNMLGLARGAAMAVITDWFAERGWKWAYRTVDSQHFGLRQRRRRVFLVASECEDPRQVLFADEAPPAVTRAVHRHYGFSWTEGNRGLGWGPGVTPTLKGGSTVGISSPPAVWRSERGPGDAIVRPRIAAGEALQGFRAGWTEGARDGARWKMVGNAVSVPVAAWIGRRIAEPGPPVEVHRKPFLGGRWPTAASNADGRVEQWALSERPLDVRPRRTLGAVLDRYGSEPLSHGATAGFASRLERSSLRYDPEFMVALKAHVAVTA